jgi:hypothetical protein
MTSDPGGTVDRHRVSVVSRGARDTWLLEVIEHQYPNLELVLRAPGQTWTAGGTDVFGALMKLREALDAEDVQVCCNGARRNAWASGMQAQMGRGRVVYLLSDEPGRPLQVGTLDDAPPDQVVRVEEQTEFYAGWLARRNSQGE